MLFRLHKTWSRLAKGGSDTELALLEAFQTLASGFKPNAYALVHLLRASTNLGWDSFSQQLHSYIIRSGYYSHVFVSVALVRFYVRADSLPDAHKVFVEVSRRNSVSWSTLISGYVQSGQFRKALRLFHGLDKSEVYPDAFSLSSSLVACAQLGFLKLGMSIHSKSVKCGVESNIVIGNCLIHMYGKCGCVDEAVNAFYEMVGKDTISWNSVIAASVCNGKIEQAYSFFRHMPNPDAISYNELINGVAQAGNMEDAIQILSSMPNPNSSSWNSIITGYVNRDRARDALYMFSKMHSKDMKMDEYTFSSILSGIAGVSALTWGMLIHCMTIKCGLDVSVVVGSAIIDMYSKCGQIKNAKSVFRLLPKRNVITWNAMISGYAHNGSSAEVIHLFEQLKMEKGIKPDGITFLNVLTACWHNQMQLELAFGYFNSMINECGIVPTPEHCCSMIRLLGQGGDLQRAERMIYEQGFESRGSVWRALLGVCETFRDLNVAEIAAIKVIDLEGDEDYVYVKLSNIYASCGRWLDVSAIRERMRKRQVRKEVGSSWIELEDSKVVPNVCIAER